MNFKILCTNLLTFKIFLKDFLRLKLYSLLYFDGLIRKIVATTLGL